VEPGLALPRIEVQPRLGILGTRSGATKTMNHAETVESHLLQTSVPHEQLNESTWIVQLEDQRHSRIAVKVQDPIVLFSTPILELSANTPNREGLFRALLELNADLMHSAYGLEGERVILSGAQQASSLSLHEFQAVLDDMTMALDTHSEKLAAWIGRTTSKA
jgi:hypothetical protein